jgi:hypothetical protein
MTKPLITLYFKSIFSKIRYPLLGASQLSPKITIRQVEADIRLLTGPLCRVWDQNSQTFRTLFA